MSAERVETAPEFMVNAELMEEPDWRTVPAARVVPVPAWTAVTADNTETAPEFMVNAELMEVPDWRIVPAARVVPAPACTDISADNVTPDLEVKAVRSIDPLPSVTPAVPSRTPDVRLSMPALNVSSEATV